VDDPCTGRIERIFLSSADASCERPLGSTDHVVPGRARRSVRLAARVGVVTVASSALGIAMAADAFGQDTSPTLFVLSIVAFGWVALGLYEGAVWLTTAALGRLVGPSRPTAAHSPRGVFTPVRSLLVLSAYFLGSITTVAVLEMGVMLAGGADVAPSVASPELAWILPIALAAGALVALAAFRRLATRRDLVVVRRLFRRRARHDVLAAAMGGILFALFVAFVLPHFLPVSESYAPGPVTRMAARGGWPRIWLAITAIAVAPVAEESLFRGVVLEGILRRFGRLAAVAVTTVLFGLAHMPDVLGHGPAIAAILTGGVALAELRLRAGSLVLPITAHAAYNTVVVALSFVS